MPDQPNTIPAAAQVDAGAQPQPQANGMDVPAWAMDLQKRLEGVYRETVEARKEFRAGQKQTTTQTAATSAPAAAPDMEARFQALQSQIEQQRREILFRDSLDARGVPAAQRKLVSRLFAAERPDNVEEWIGATLPDFAPAAPAAQPPKPAPASAPVAAPKPTAPASAAPVMQTTTADVFSPEMLAAGTSMTREEWHERHRQLLAREGAGHVRATPPPRPRK